jgi:membrane AbrB-like protein
MRLTADPLRRAARRLRPPPPGLLGRMALALLVGTLAGALAQRAGLPLPWMLGPMIGCALVALAGAPVRAPLGLRPVVVPVIGVMLGSGFHPGLLGHVAAWTGSLLLLPPFLLAAGGASYVVFRRLGGYDPVTAFYSAAPGGLNEMTLMGAEAGGDETRIALAHAVRIFVVVSAVALIFALGFGARSADGPGAFVGFADLPPRDLALLLACALAGTWAGTWLRLPAASLFGPMVLSAAVHLAGIVALPPPSLLVIAAQVAIGTILGCRFAGSRLSQIGRDVALGAAATAAMLVVTIAFAALTAMLTTTGASQALLAFSPGGLAEMSLLALAMGGDVAYVATLHIVRIVIVLLSVPLLARIAAPRLFGRDRL